MTDLQQYETVIGFDARVMWISKDELWDANRLKAFTWGYDTPRILSTDDMVWPQLFTGYVPGPNGDVTWTVPKEPEPWIGPNAPHWSSLVQLEVNLAEHVDQLPGPIWIVAVTCVAEPTVMAQCKYGPHLGEAQPASIDSDWLFLGYDVSDGGTLSGLLNCGISARDARAYWIADLNDNHLFQTIEIADEFRQFIDKQVKEHSPFAICGLYKIKELVPTLPASH